MTLRLAGDRSGSRVRRRRFQTEGMLLSRATIRGNPKSTTGRVNRCATAASVREAMNFVSSSPGNVRPAYRFICSLTLRRLCDVAS